MSNAVEKVKNATRRHRDEVAVKKQLKIAKQHGQTFNDLNVREPHRLAKRHAMDCGNPECYLCGNPRKIHKDKLTAQEKRIFQDLEKQTDKHSNGIPPKEE